MSMEGSSQDTTVYLKLKQAVDEINRLRTDNEDLRIQVRELLSKLEGIREYHQ